MKIAFLIRYFEPGVGGAENNCYYLARELAKDKKNDVHIFCSNKEEKEEIIDNIKIHKCKEVLGITYYLAFYPSITKKIINLKPDILHVHGFGFIQNDISIKEIKNKFPKTKLVCTPHGPFMALKNYSLPKRIIKSIYIRFIRKNLKMYDKIIQVNPHQESWMKKEYGIPKDKIEFLPNGVPEELFRVKDKKEIKRLKKKYELNGKKIITYLGRIQEYKGIDQIIEALPDLDKNTVFIGMGKNSGDKERLNKLSKQKGVEERVIFPGKVSEKEKLAFLDISDVFVFPSEWEAFGIVILEAMARGNAVVSTKTEGGKYLVNKENGYVYNFGDISRLREILLRLLRNKKELKSMKRNNLQKSKKYKWNRIVKDLVKIYKNA